MPDVRELTVGQRVKRILASSPSYLGDEVTIALAVALATGGSPATQDIEQLTDDLEGLNEQRAALRKQYEDLRIRLDQELATLRATLADPDEIKP